MCNQLTTKITTPVRPRRTHFDITGVVILTLLEVIIFMVDKPNVETTRFRFIQKRNRLVSTFGLSKVDKPNVETTRFLFWIKRNRVVSTFGLSNLKIMTPNNVEITTPVMWKWGGRGLTGVVILVLVECTHKRKWLKPKKINHAICSCWRFNVA